MKKTKNTKKLKIAVQLFGNLRTFNQCAPILKKELLNHYDCDVFMHTWDTIDHDNITWHDYKVSQPKDLTHEEIEKKVRSYYDLKDFKVEKQVDEDYGNVLAITREISLCGMKAMMHSMKSANDMREKYQKENKVKYDFVVVLRPDVFLNRKLDINEFLERMTEEEINNSLFTGGLPSLSLLSHFKYLVATDVLFFAKPEIISKQCKLLIKLLKLCNLKVKSHLVQNITSLKKLKTWELLPSL